MHFKVLKNKFRNYRNLIFKNNIYLYSENHKKKIKYEKVKTR